MRVTVEFTTPIPRLSETVEMAVYRIAQEALTNAFRHASASAIAVTLGVTDAVRLEIRDDGCGFDPHDRTRMHSFGLGSIGERALAVGGALGIESSPGAGTTVRFTCPSGPRRSG